MPTGRRHLGCGVVRDAQGISREVVVFGGYNATERRDEVEIYNIRTGEWRRGTKTDKKKIRGDGQWKVIHTT